MKRIAPFVLTLSAIALTSSIAFGGEPASPTTAATSSASVTEAKQLFGQGLKDVDGGRLTEARERFERAYTLVPSADILWNLALTEKKIGLSKDALLHFRAYGADSMARPEKAQLARSYEAELASKVGRIVTAAKAGSIVTVDGAMVTPGEVSVVEPGPHAVEFRIGTETKNVVVQVEAGTLSEVTPPVSPEAKAERPAYVATVDARSETSSKKSEFPWLSVGLGVGAGVAVLGGVYLGLQSSEKIDDRERAWSAVQNQRSGCKPGDPLCDRYTETKHDAQMLQTASIALFTTGGLLGGAAIGSWLAKRGDDRAIRVAIQPTGLSATGRF